MHLVGSPIISSGRSLNIAINKRGNRQLEGEEA